MEQVSSYSHYDSSIVCQNTLLCNLQAQRLEDLSTVTQIACNVVLILEN